MTTYNKGKKTKSALPPVSEDPLVLGKVAPNARDLEEAVLGAIMLEKGAYDQVSKTLRPECFYVEGHKHVFEAFTELSKAAAPIDILTVIEKLKQMGTLDAAGGAHAVTTLTNSVVSSAHLEFHAGIIHDKYLLREQARIYAEALGKCYEQAAEGYTTLDETNARLLNLSIQHQRGEITHIGDELVRVVQKVQDLMQSGEDVTGVTSGFPSVDKITTGWQAPDLIVLAARPSVGKTAFALNLARNAAMDPKRPTPTAFFSLEMSKEQLTQRLLAAECEIWLERIRKGKMEEGDLKKMYINGIQPLASAPLFIDDTGGLNVFELRSKVRRLKQQENIGLVVVDYLQLMTGTGRPGASRENEVGEISRALKALCKELHIPIIALSQLNREAEGGVPSLKMLRESGSIEQDADVVAFLTRPSYEKIDDKIDPALRNTVDIHFRKNRQGPLEDVPMYAVLEIQKFMEEDTYNRYMERIGQGRFRPVAEVVGDWNDDNPF
jgi:replicative DNA helicase